MCYMYCYFTTLPLGYYDLLYIAFDPKKVSSRDHTNVQLNNCGTNFQVNQDKRATLFPYDSLHMCIQSSKYHNRLNDNPNNLESLYQ